MPPNVKREEPNLGEGIVGRMTKRDRISGRPWVRQYERGAEHNALGTDEVEVVPPEQLEIDPVSTSLWTGVGLFVERFGALGD